ncbi:unnamed protein product [Sphagnum troendelagicum]
MHGTFGWYSEAITPVRLSHPPVVAATVLVLLYRTKQGMRKLFPRTFALCFCVLVKRGLRDSFEDAGRKEEAIGLMGLGKRRIRWSGWITNVENSTYFFLGSGSQIF